MRTWLGEDFSGSELYSVYREVKHLFDPRGLMNPGKVVDGPPIDRNLRMGPDYRVMPVHTQLDFTDESGFHRAIEVCSGIGVCRKLEEGTMCPSFRATRLEEDSTRGRANILRMAISGKLGPEGLSAPEVRQAMDLCIACKACKAECPSAVDMARLRTEWLAQYRERHRMPLREWIFARFPDLVPLLRLFRPFQGLMAHRPVRKLLQQWPGIAAERALPRVQRPFRPAGSAGEQAGKAVALWADSFYDAQHPEVVQAAYELLRGLGYRVHLLTGVCCGRTLLSEGMVPAARRRASRTVARLTDVLDRVDAVVGLEPSCLLTLRDEYRYLLPEDRRVAALGERARLLDEFLLQEGHRCPSDAPRPVAVHTHCHQKALVGVETTLEVLRRWGFDPVAIPAGCCGMAGAFGYHAEHYAISLAMAEERLAPFLRSWPEEAPVVAAGISCRTQMGHVTGRRAMHPAELLGQRLHEVQAAASRESAG